MTTALPPPPATSVAVVVASPVHPIHHRGPHGNGVSPSSSPAPLPAPQAPGSPTTAGAAAGAAAGGAASRLAPVFAVVLDAPPSVAVFAAWLAGLLVLVAASTPLLRAARDRAPPALAA
jgi:hypothetical protein